jgi:hypothetical protein
MITPDTAAAGLGAAACYLFWHWLRRPELDQALAAGFTLGLAELCKTTWLILVPLWPALWLGYRAGSGMPWRRWAREAAQLTAAGAFALYLLNAGYGFENVGRRLGDFPFVSRTLGGGSGREPGNVLAGTSAAGVRLPVPSNYLQGIDVQKSDFESGMRSYLCGTWRTRGWWYYYLFGLLVKTPVGTLALATLAVAAWPFVRLPGAGWRDEVALLAPGLAVLGFVSSQTGFNHHLRYVLLAFPFLLVGIGRVAVFPTRRWRVVVAVLAGATVVSSLVVYPHSMSYFNEPAGGPMRGGEYLLDSNLDWGQNLLFLKAWYDANPDARPLRLAYFGYIDPRAAGIEFTLLPRLVPAEDGRTARWADRPEPGWYAVSVPFLRETQFSVPDGHGGGEYVRGPYFTYLSGFRPVATVGNTIWIYHLSADDVARLPHQ